MDVIDAEDFDVCYYRYILIDSLGLLQQNFKSDSTQNLP